MKKRTALLIGGLALFVLLCSGCTSAFTNAETYFSNTGDILSILFDSNQSINPNESTTDSAATQLDTPSNFTLDADGNYSFDGVEGAEYYLLYFCAPTATEDGDDFLYSSQNIPAENGTGSYSGNVNDLIDYAYGSYLVKVFAFPELGYANYSMSKAATAEYTVSGAMEAPQIDYFWNTFNGTMELQLTNIDHYTYQVYPDQVEIIFTNLDNSTDQVTVSLESPSPGHSSISTDLLTRGTTYHISAIASSSSEYVTNATTEAVSVSESVTLDNINVITDGFYYTDNIKGELVYPRVTLAFDLSNGGSLGAPLGTYGQCRFQVTPATPASGAQYSYDLQIEMDVWDNMVWTMAGALTLYEDGTLLLEEFGMQGPVPSSSISGFWLDNGDGTATLCYDPSTVTVG